MSLCLFYALNNCKKCDCIVVVNKVGAVRHNLSIG